MKNTVTTVCMMVFIVSPCFGEALLALDSLQLKDGRKYERVTISKKDTESVSISHSSGMAKVGYEELPDNVAKMLNFEPLDKQEYVTRKQQRAEIETVRARNKMANAAKWEAEMIAQKRIKERENQEAGARVLESLRQQRDLNIQKERELAKKYADEYAQRRQLQEQQAATQAAAWAAAARQVGFAGIPEDGRKQDSDLEIARRNQQLSEIEVRQRQLQMDVDRSSSATPYSGNSSSRWPSPVVDPRFSHKSEEINREMDSYKLQTGNGTYDRRQADLKLGEIQMRQQQLERDMERQSAEMEAERNRQESDRIRRLNDERFQREADAYRREDERKREQRFYQ